MLRPGMPLSAIVTNAMQKVQVDTESTCQVHPLLKQGDALPRSKSFEISPQELFGIATLRTQSPETGNYTFNDCYKGWPHMLGNLCTGPKTSRRSIGRDGFPASWLEIA